MNAEIKNSLSKVPVSEPEKSKKKHHRLRNLLITLGVIIIILLIGVAATGIYQVPLISATFGFNKPKDLGVKTSEQALISLKQNIPLKIENKTVDYLNGPAGIFSGEIKVDTQITDEEITSWLNRFEGRDPIFTDTQVKRYEGGLEISTMLSKYTKAPIYLKVGITQASDKAISLHLEKAKLGMFNVPDNLRQQAEDFFEEKINKLIQEIPGFTMEKFELHPGYSVFKGTMPASVKKSEQGWSGLLLL